MPIIALLKGKVYEFPKSSDDCVLRIDIGQHCCEGEKLEATIKRVAEVFHSVTIVVFGELQRFTKAMDSSSHDPDAFREEAIQDGRNWVERNRKSIDLLREHVDEKGIRHENKLVKIIEFGDCIREKKTEYDKWMGLLQRRSVNPSDPFKRALKGSITGFIQRCIKSGKEMPLEKIADELSQQYVLEECAGLLAWKDLEDFQFQFLVYPGQLNPAVLYLFENIVHNDKPTILQPLTVEFPKHEYKTLLDEKPEDQATSSEPRKKPAELVKEGNSQETESARGYLEDTEKHLKELTVDPGTSSTECPEELLSPDAQEHQVREILLRVNSIARKLDAPCRMRFAVGLTIVAGKYLSEGYSPGFGFTPKKFDTTPAVTGLPTANPCQ